MAIINYFPGGGGAKGLLPQIVVTVDTGSVITCTDGTKTLTGTSTGSYTFEIPNYGTWTVTATLSGKTASKTVVIDTVKQYAVELAYTKIYGISWSGGPSTAWTRTDDAAGFSDPVPALSNGNGSSPFDNCYPWNGMVKESRTGGVMVKIPKYWFKWTKNGSTLALQIADKAADGFSVSPAHMDRGDGKGERDYVYVGRYHCNSSCLSATGSSPIASITRDTARSSIHAKGSTIWQMDYAMRLTIWMLMLVEFADNDFQAKIGYGCGDSSAVGAMGYTDSMTYHTGTTQSARTTYGLGTQYRYIEGLWDNVEDWMDGCYYSSSGMSVIKNPANFSDTANGTVIGTPTAGYPSVMSLSTASGFEWCIYPTTSSGSTTTYFPDYWNFGASNPCLCAGGCYNQGLNYGAFYVSYASTPDTYASIGCRLQELP